jgi:adenosylmethionine-8-amino-7-oxononanoate aminotransferase
VRKDWLHFYQMDFIDERSNYPKTLVEGEGCYVTDSEGKSYFDSLSGAFCVNLGYGNRELLDAGYECAKKINFTSPFSVANEQTIELADRISDSLVNVFNQEAQVFFTNGGSEAIDTALKLALAISRKQGQDRKFFISMANSYHGTTFGAASICGYERCRSQTGNLYKEVIFAPNSSACAGCSCQTNDCASMSSFFDKLPVHPREIAGIIVEAVENQAGNYPVPLNFMTTISRFCEQHGILLIIDEVITGFGRTGAQWAIEEYAVEPDILVSAKGLTSGYESLGATAIKKSLELNFRGDDDHYFAHGSTFGGRPSACAVANKVFMLQKQQNIFAHVKTNARLIEKRLQEFREEFSFIHDISGKGFLWSIRFSGPIGERALKGEIVEQLCGLGVLPCLYQSRKFQFLEFAPPLITTETELKDVLDKYYSVFKNLA